MKGNPGRKRRRKFQGGNKNTLYQRVGKRNGNLKAFRGVQPNDPHYRASVYARALRRASETAARQ